MYICNNCKQILIQKVYLKSCYVKLCKRLHLANYDITISLLPIQNTGYAEVPLRVYGYATIFPQAALLWCSDFPLEMHYGGEKLGKEWSDFDPQRKGSYFWSSGLWCKVASKLNGICDRRRGDRQKDRQTHRHG